MNLCRNMLVLLALSSSNALLAQSVSLQFMQSEYDVKELQMVNEEVGFAVGGAHWNQDQKAFRSTILKTTDGGITWKRQDVSYSKNLWDVDFTDQDHGWVAGESGFLLSTNDGGNSWTRKDPGTTLDFRSLCFADASHGWAVANEVLVNDYNGDPEAWKGRIWHTSDGGENWSEQYLPADAGLIHSIYFKNPLEGWAIGIKNIAIDPFAETRCAAYHTSNGGETWVEKYSPDLEFIFTDIDFPDDEHGYMVGFKTSSGETNGCMFRTSDGGNTWQRSSEESDVLWEVAFTDSLRGYAVGADYYSAWGPPVYRTLDGRHNWEIIMIEEHDNQGLYGLSVFENKVTALGDDGFLIQSSDPWGEIPMAHEGQLFTSELIDTLYHFEDIYFITPLKGWVVGQKSAGPHAWAQVILHTENGGDSWTEQYALQIDPVWAFSFRLNAVQFVTETTGWAVGYVHDFGDTTTSGVLFTNDGGQTWTQQAQGVADGQIVDLFFLDNQNGWALQDYNLFPEDYIQLLKTSDSGDNWEIVSTGQEGNVTIGFAVKTGSLFFQDENTGWILGAQCDLLKTEDGGASWMKVALPQEYSNTHDIAFSSDRNGTICGESNFHTTDGGATWNEGYTSQRTFTDLTFTDSLNGWMVGEQGEIHYSNNGGNSWEMVEHRATGAALKAVSFPDGNNGWAAGRAGTIVHIDPSAVSSASQAILTRPSSGLFQNHPNPFSAQTEISFSMTNPGNATLSVYDMSGRKVITLAEGFRSKGIQTIIWDGQDEHGNQVRSGVYIYKLVTEEGSVSKSMVVLGNGSQ